MNRNVFFMSVLIFITILFLVSTSYALTLGGSVPPEGGGQGRTPVPPEEKPIEEEDCPDAFSDSSCGMTGFSMGKWANEAWGAAAIICDGMKAGCITEQNQEFANAQAICEQVEGCKLTAVTDFKACGAGSSNKTDCNPGPGLHDTGGVTWYKCTVTGHYNITDYECERPEA